MAERRSPKPQVGGSIPSWPAKKLASFIMGNGLGSIPSDIEVARFG